MNGFQICDGLSQARDALKVGITIKIRPQGNSMKGHIESGQLVTISPENLYDFKVNDIVLVQMNEGMGSIYLHLIQAVSNNRYLIGNARGHSNGWVNKKHIFGRVISVED